MKNTSGERLQTLALIYLFRCLWSVFGLVYFMGILMPFFGPKLFCFMILLYSAFTCKPSRTLERCHKISYINNNMNKS